MGFEEVSLKNHGFNPLFSHQFTNDFMVLIHVRNVEGKKTQYTYNK